MFILEFICAWCAGHADAGKLKHNPCERPCDCQHGHPRVHHDRRK